MTEGDTYESVALAYYGAPLNGIFLRQEATKAYPEAGDVIEVPNARNYYRLRREPKAYSLSEASAALGARKAWFDASGTLATMPLVVR